MAPQELCCVIRRVSEVRSLPAEVCDGSLNKVDGCAVSAVLHQTSSEGQLALPETLGEKTSVEGQEQARAWTPRRQTHTFESRNIIPLGRDVQIFSSCFFELAEGLFDSGGLVDAVDGTGMQLMGLPKGLQGCREAPAVQVGLA